MSAKLALSNRKKRKRASGGPVDTSAWRVPDVGVLSAEDRQTYFDRQNALKLYLSGVRGDELKARSGVGERHIRRTIKERCLEIHTDGLPYGWRGLVPRLQISSHLRSSPFRKNSSGKGKKGALSVLFTAEPAIYEAFVKRIILTSKRNVLAEANITKERHWIWFIGILRQKGYEHENRWPFDTAGFARRTICSFVDKVLAWHPDAAAELAGGKNSVAKLKSGDGTKRPVWRFMQRVEMDAHKIDGLFTVVIPKPTGGHQEMIVHRLYVIVILDTYSRLALAHYVSLRPAIAGEDVMRVVKRALQSWTRLKIHFGDEAYSKNAGFLSACGEAYVGLCWNEMSVDGEMALSTTSLRDFLANVVGCKLLLPQDFNRNADAKDIRPFIEPFFKNLAERGFHRLSNTTGSNVGQKRGRSPEKVALRSSFQIEYVEEMVDVLIANYNATPHSSLGNDSPLEYAKRAFADQHEHMRYADPTLVEDLCSVRQACVIKGGAASGRRPYIAFAYGTYTNDLLQNAFHLVGQTIWITVNDEDDIRTVKASSADGTRLGILRVAPPWHMSPHSLMVRRAIACERSRKNLHYTVDQDPIQVFMDHYERQPGKRLPMISAYLNERRILDAAIERQWKERNERESEAESDVDRNKLAMNRPIDKEAEPTPTERRKEKLDTFQPRFAKAR